MKKKRLACGLFVFFWAGLLRLVFAAQATGEPARLTSVRPVLHAREMEVIIQIKGPFRHTFYELQGPPRLVIDLTPVAEIASPGVIRLGAFGVETIQTAQSQPGTAQVVFELTSPLPFYLVNTRPDGLQVVFLTGAAGKRIETPENPPVEPRRPAAEQPAGPSPALTDRLPRRQTTLIGLSLSNISLAEERFQRVFGHRTESCLAVDVSQVFLTKGPWALAAAAEYRRLSLEGQSTVSAQATRALITPLDLGLRLILQRRTFWPYISAGPVFCQYEERSSLQDTVGYTTGFSLQTGFYWGPASFQILKAKVYVKWTRAVAEENGLKVNLGGVELGAGLALGFSLI